MSINMNVQDDFEKFLSSYKLPDGELTPAEGAWGIGAQIGFKAANELYAPKWKPIDEVAMNGNYYLLRHTQLNRKLPFIGKYIERYNVWRSMGHDIEIDKANEYCEIPDWKY